MQDPVLFSGTLRSNIDPFNEHTDEELWSVIEMSGMKTMIEELSNQLNHEIAECGENLRLIRIDGNFFISFTKIFLQCWTTSTDLSVASFAPQVENNNFGRGYFGR